MDELPPVERSRQRHLTLEAIHYQPSQSEIQASRVRAWYALMLARTPEAWSQLLQGKQVPVDQLDFDRLRRATLRRVK